jgi:beta-lactam-binding protein with PASTA domain
VASGQNEVPDVKGKTNTEASALLENAGFTPKEEPRETADAAPGTVVDQTPAGKKLARLGSTVTIFVATAPTSTPTPTDTTISPPAPP